MDLISKKALLNHLNDVWLTNTPNGSYDMQAAKAEGIAIAMKAVEDFRTVPAAPLDKLCEWLERNAAGRWNGLEYTAAGWKDELTRWMEEQDAAFD